MLAIWYGARFILGKGYTGGQVLNVFDVKLLHSVASDLLLKEMAGRVPNRQQEGVLKQRYIG
ncbi:hypothetical protein KY289_028421 [Solanum tuberosum]|nr:hypothetical protein KY289_028421 [Solanum tuberosum]